MRSFWDRNLGDIVLKLKQLGIVLTNDMSQLLVERKREVARLAKRLEALSFLDPDDDNLVEMEEIRIVLNWEADKEEIEWEQKARANWLKFWGLQHSLFP